MPAQRVGNANIPPRSAVGFLAMQWSTGATFVGSGALIDNQNVLTCSHNLVDPITNPQPRGHATQVLFYPGFNQQVVAMPPPNGLPASAGYYSNFFAAGQDAWDVGLVRLAAPVPNPPAAYFVPTLTGEEIVGEDVILTGYPGPRNGEMWEDDDQVAGVDVGTNTLIYTNDTWPGNSGSPIWTYDAVADVVAQHGIHVSRQAQELRRGVLITAAILDWINGAWAHNAGGGGFNLYGG